MGCVPRTRLTRWCLLLLGQQKGKDVLAKVSLRRRMP